MRRLLLAVLVIAPRRAGDGRGRRPGLQGHRVPRPRPRRTCRSRSGSASSTGSARPRLRAVADRAGRRSCTTSKALPSRRRRRATSSGAGLSTPGAAVTRYLRRHPEISGWWDVRDDWPRGPYVAVFLTDDSAAPTRARSSAWRRSRSHARGEDPLQRPAARAGRSGGSSATTKALERRASRPSRPTPRPGTDRVDVSVVTKRKDAARYFKRRYGVADPHARHARDHRSRVRAGGPLHDRAGRAEPDGQLERRAAKAGAHRGDGVPRTSSRSGSSCATASTPASATPAARDRQAERAARRAPRLRRLRRVAAAADRPSPGDPPCPSRRPRARRRSSRRSASARSTA